MKPVLNRLVDQKMRLRTLQMEKKRLESLQNRPSLIARLQRQYRSQTPPKLSLKKKLVMEEMKNTEIQRENRILLEKMNHIFAASRKRSQSYHQFSMAGNSLNDRMRRDRSKERKRIHTENLVMHEKVSKVVSHYKMPKRTEMSPQRQSFSAASTLALNAEPTKRPRRSTVMKIRNRQIPIPCQAPSSSYRQVLFEGPKIIQGKQYFMQAIIQGGKFKLKADQNNTKMTKFLEMSEKDYHRLEKWCFDGEGVSRFIDKYIQIRDVMEVVGLDELVESNLKTLSIPERKTTSKNKKIKQFQIQQRVRKTRYQSFEEKLVA